MSFVPASRYLDPDRVSTKTIMAVLAGEAAEDQIGRNQVQLEEAVDISAAVESMSQSGFAAHEIAQAVARNPNWFPQAYVILRRYAESARRESGEWLDRERARDREQAIEGRSDAQYQNRETA